jgi:pentatricopeptide repeat protein
VVAACAAARDADAALATLATMRASATPVTARACNAALSACERAGRWRDAVQLLKSMEAEGPPPDSASVRCVVFACCAAEPGPPRLAEAKALFRRCRYLRVMFGMLCAGLRTACSWGRSFENVFLASSSGCCRLTPRAEDHASPVAVTRLSSVRCGGTAMA